MPLRSGKFAGVPQLERCLVDDSAHLLRGSSGDGVMRVQEALMQLGEDLPQFGADGKYGQETEAAVISFKTKRDILNFAGRIDGVVGKKTIRRLDDEMSQIVPTTGGA